MNIRFTPATVAVALALAIFSVTVIKGTDLAIKNIELKTTIAEKEGEIANLRGQIAYQQRATEKLRLFAEHRYAECTKQLRQFQD